MPTQRSCRLKMGLWVVGRRSSVVRTLVAQQASDLGLTSQFSFHHSIFSLSVVLTSFHVDWYTHSHTRTYTTTTQQRAKDSKSRLALDDLLIKPVQRIPRYVLFIKDLLKHTAITHPDHAPLQQALGELTTLVECVNASERERDRLEQQKELMMAVDGLAHVRKKKQANTAACIRFNIQKSMWAGGIIY